MEIFSEFKSYFLAGHLISIASGMGAALISDGLFSFYSKDKILSLKERRILSTLSNVVWISLGVIILTGLCIFLSNPALYSVSVKFLVKMSIVGVLTLNGYALFRLVQPHLTRNFLTLHRERKTRRIAFACGAVSLVSWVSALGLGLSKNISISYIEAMTIYGIIILFAVIVSVTIEKKTFES